ncbi:hypothetical protein ACGFX2_07700 [Streptomyces goshikiensis]|uniref:hypothetical protein n=1 Tax=Streptomyces goshikiensis TaxID=1942 RepID=UPI003720AA3E
MLTLTVVTGPVDAVLGFARAGAQGLSAPASITALGASSVVVAAATDDEVIQVSGTCPAAAPIVVSDESQMWVAWQ